MSTPFLIRISDTASPKVTAMGNALTSPALTAGVGEAVQRLFEEHLRSNGPNKRHWPTTHFWPRAARTVSWQAAEDDVVICINQVGVRQRYLGGPIAPTGNHQFLTIPLRAEAYGKRATDFNNLKVAYCQLDEHAWGLALVEADAAQAKRVNSAGISADQTGGGAYFLLVRSVYQEPDPSVLPYYDEVQQAAIEGAEAVIWHTHKGQ